LQGEADYINLKEMQKRGIEVAKSAKNRRYKGRANALDPVTVKAWRAEQKTSRATTAEHFGISVAAVKRYRAALDAIGCR